MVSTHKLIRPRTRLTLRISFFRWQSFFYWHYLNHSHTTLSLVFAVCTTMMCRWAIRVRVPNNVTEALSCLLALVYKSLQIFNCRRNCFQLLSLSHSPLHSPSLLLFLLFLFSPSLSCFLVLHVCVSLHLFFIQPLILSYSLFLFSFSFKENIKEKWKEREKERERVE